MEVSMDNGRAHAQVHQHETYQHKKHIKQGSQRLDRRSGAGVHGQPKKSGNGGKFTWEGSALEEQNDQDIALDEKDPNYEEEEQAEENEKPSVEAVKTEEPAPASQVKQE